MAKIGKHSLNELIRQLSFKNSLNGEVNVKADRGNFFFLLIDISNFILVHI